MSTIILISVASILLFLLVINRFRNTKVTDQRIAEARSRAVDRQYVAVDQVVIVGAAGLAGITATVLVDEHTDPSTLSVEQTGMIDSVLAELQTVPADLIEDINFELDSAWSASRD